jgi:hypothetical protein
LKLHPETKVAWSLLWRSRQGLYLIGINGSTQLCEYQPSDYIIHDLFLNVKPVLKKIDMLAFKMEGFQQQFDLSICYGLGQINQPGSELFFWKS